MGKNMNKANLPSKCNKRKWCIPVSFSTCWKYIEKKKCFYKLQSKILFYQKKKNKFVEKLYDIGLILENKTLKWENIMGLLSQNILPLCAKVLKHSETFRSILIMI